MLRSGHALGHADEQEECGDFDEGTDDTHKRLVALQPKYRHRHRDGQFEVVARRREGHGRIVAVTGAQATAKEHA